MTKAMDPDFTTVVAVDKSHLQELRLVWPTWRLHRAEILDHPLLVICDAQISHLEWKRELSFINHPQATLALWDLPRADQREKMLNGLVFATARHVNTPWYLKLDTDAVALTSANWIDPAWFLSDAQGQLPAYISSPWPYTKPKNAIALLDDWGDSVERLGMFPRLNLPTPNTSTILRHRRITGWCFFGNSASTREAAAMCSERLPVPSQDTFLWYVAERRREFYRCVQMKRYGWAHVPNRRRLARITAEVLSGSEGRADREKASSLSAVSPPAHREMRTRSAAPLRVAEEIAKTIMDWAPSRASGALVGVTGEKISRALSNRQPDWQLFTIPWGYPSENFDLGEDRTKPALSIAPGNDYQDFLVFEAETNEERLLQLFKAWWPLLREGGVMVGLNYGHPRDVRGQWGVRQAVETFSRNVVCPVILRPQTVWVIPKGRAIATKHHTPTASDVTE